jgi:hypothetical protein
MKHKQSWFAAMALVISVGVVGCGQVASPSSADALPQAVQLSAPDSSGVKTVTLSAEAAQRLGIATALVRQVPAQASKTVANRPQLVIPYAALVYDDQGQTWAYVASEALTFVRRAVSVNYIDGTQAYLSAGPQRGTAVVTTGSEELLGAEYEISGE